MRMIKWLSLAAGAILIISCFFPWVIIESKNIVVTGVNATGTSFGKPGYLNIFFTVLYLIFLAINKVGGFRANIFIAAFNMGWALRNYVLIPACDGGDCPQKQPAIFILVFASLALLVLAFFGGNKSFKEKNNDDETD